MGRRVVAAAVVAAASAWPAAADVRVQQVGEQLSVQATAAPVSEVLDRLARQTGMQVVYEGAPPRVPVTLSIERRTAAEAVFSVLEGLGLNYALRLDESGGRVMTLVMAGAAAPATPGAASKADARRGVPPGQVPPYPPPPSYPQEAPTEEDLTEGTGVIPPPAPQPPQEFLVNPQHQAQPEQAAPEPSAPPSLGAGFSSPSSSGGFSSPPVFGNTPFGPATSPPPPPQFVPETPPPEEKEP